MARWSQLAPIMNSLTMSRSSTKSLLEKYLFTLISTISAYNSGKILTFPNTRKERLFMVILLELTLRTKIKDIQLFLQKLCGKKV